VRSRNFIRAGRAGCTWLSGASGEGTNDGTFASWRGTPQPIFGSWSDDNANMQNFWQMDSNIPNNYAGWTGSGDIAVGAFTDDGQTWAGAASGAYDAMWTNCLMMAKSKWTAISRGTLYLRFAHEWNGNWYHWSVDSANIANFQAAWARFRALQQQIFPACKLVCCINGETNGQTYNWVNALPDSSSYDILGVDYYSNHWLYTAAYDGNGGPRRLDTIKAAAVSIGKPISVSEWGNNSDSGDHPEYIAAMHDFYALNAGTGPGQVLYDIYFNVIWSPNKFGLYPEAQTLAPNAASMYKQLF